MPTEPTIICPSCKSEIKLTESLAAPLIESTRAQYEKRMADKDAEVQRRESALREQKESLDKARAAVDEEVAKKLDEQRALIAAEEAKKARRDIGSDLDKKAKELEELNEVLRQRDL
ncbi:MAG: hypothetical protein KC983_01490, partial [Phycisphaerales bacterium]|nr:hypothetical protein [Phycisphaerales bacterium]